MKIKIEPKPEIRYLENPVDWYNSNVEFLNIFKYMQIVTISDTEVCIPDQNNSNQTTFSLLANGKVYTHCPNKFDTAVGSELSKFQILTACKFKGNYKGALMYVWTEEMRQPLEYIRVGCDYFKVMYKDDLFNIKMKKLKKWSKDEIKQDYGATFLQQIPKFDDFVIVPDNKNYQAVVGNFYNLYCEFPHREHEERVTKKDIPATMFMLEHLFGAHPEIGMPDQVDVALEYLKVMYDHPKQALPILVITSKQRKTGKTTFLNFLHMIFGANATTISPADLENQFNESYATKNLVQIDETIINKQGAIEKLKSLTTAKMINMNMKHVSNVPLPAYIKVTIFTNKDTDFIRIDNEEVRYWIRVAPVLKKEDTRTEEKLQSEIPKFLKYLSQMPGVDLLQDRMVFPPSRIETVQLDKVKKESRSELYKELQMKIEEMFMNECWEVDSFEATALDIHREWFERNNRISSAYVRKVLKEEFGLVKTKPHWYRPFNRIMPKSSSGEPYVFERSKFIIEDCTEQKIESKLPAVDKDEYDNSIEGVEVYGGSVEF